MTATSAPRPQAPEGPASIGGSSAMGRASIRIAATAASSSIATNASASDAITGQATREGSAQRNPAITEATGPLMVRSEEHTSELQSPCNLVCRLLLEKKNK